jgi:hypothetical protein
MSGVTSYSREVYEAQWVAKHAQFAFLSRVKFKMAGTVEGVQNQMKQELENFQGIQKSTLEAFLFCSLFIVDFCI